MLSELFEFRTEVEEVPWITEATEELIEDIVRSKYGKDIERMPTMRKEIEEQAKRVEEVAKRFIRFCRKIGGRPKVREYASRYHGTIDLTCYFEDGAEITTMSYWGGNLSVGTDRGWDKLKLPEGLNKAEIKIKDPKKIGGVIFDEHMKPVEFRASNMFGIKEISMDIYSDHVKIDFRSETYEEVIGRE